MALSLAAAQKAPQLPCGATLRHLRLCFSLCLSKCCQPRGCRPRSRPDATANTLALRSLSLFFAAFQCGALGALAHPGSSKLRLFDEWARLLSLGARQTDVRACSFAGSSRVGFVFLAVGLDLSRLDLPCACHRNCTPAVALWLFFVSLSPCQSSCR